MTQDCFGDIVSCALCIFCISDQYAKDQGCQRMLTHIVKVLKKQFLLVLVGDTTKKEWIKSPIGMMVSGQLYIDIGHLIETVEKKFKSLSAPTSKLSVSTIFVSYCWGNSREASKEKTTGEVDPRTIAKKLKEKYDVWLDVERLEQGLFEGIAKGLHSTKLIVACVSDEYAKSGNCVGVNSCDKNPEIASCRVCCGNQQIGMASHGSENAHCKLPQCYNAQRTRLKVKF